MIRLESQPSQQLDPRIQRVANRLLFIQFALFFVNAAFAITLWLRCTGLLVIDDSFMTNVRLYLFLSMLLLALLRLLLVRKHRTLVQSKKDERAEMVAAEIDDKQVQARARVHRRWFLFERSVAYLNIGVVVMQAIRFDVFQAVFSFGIVHEAISNSVFLTVFLNQMTELALLCDFIYLCVKLPRVVGDLVGTFGRFYASRWRIHESVFGILWVIVGAAFLIFSGDGFDRLIGGLYILLGAFIVGRDYQDVRNFAFFEEVTPPGEPAGNSPATDPQEFDE